MKFSELLNFERTNPNVWKIGLNGYPLWYTVRSKLLNEQVLTPSKFSAAMLKNIISYPDMKAIDTLVTLANRPDLLRICDKLNEEYACKNILRIEGSDPISVNYQSSLAWDLIRFLCQKIFWILLAKKFRKLKAEVAPYSFNHNLDANIKKYIGDIIYLRIIDFRFRKLKKIFYTNGIIPDIAKFEGSGKYIEIQHGHISNHHPGYIGVPNINGTLLCWNENTIHRLKEIGYAGKTIHLKTSSLMQIGLTKSKVLFATVNSEQFIQDFRRITKYNEFYIKLHPKMTDLDMVNCSHDAVNYSAIRNAIVIGTSTVLHHLASAENFDELILVPFFDRERSLSKADYLALVMDEFPELRSHLTRIKVKRTDEFE